MLKISKSPLFIVFGIVRFFEIIIFVLKLGFLRPSPLCPIFVCFQRPAFFMRLFFVFIEAPSIFTRNETFCEHEGLLKVFVHYATYRRPSKNFKKNFLNFLFFYKGFRLRKMGFLLFPVGEEWFSRFMRIPSGIF